MYIKDDSILRAFQNSAEMREAVKLIENFKDLNALQKAVDYLRFRQEVSQASAMINSQKETLNELRDRMMDGEKDDRTKS